MTQGGPYVITTGLAWERWRRGRARDGTCGDRSRGQSDMTDGLKMEEAARTKECRQLPEAGKVKSEFSARASRRNAAWPTPRSNPGRLISDL